MTLKRALYNHDFEGACLKGPASATYDENVGEGVV